MSVRRRGRRRHQRDNNYDDYNDSDVHEDGDGQERRRGTNAARVRRPRIGSTGGSWEEGTTTNAICLSICTRSALSPVICTLDTKFVNER